MTELLTAAQMRAIEQAAIEGGEATGLELMERAGQGVVDAVLAWRPELAEGTHGATPKKAVVLCGPGNNGGDGFVVARLLHQRGWQVEVYLYGCPPDDLSRLPPDAQTNARRWAATSPVAAMTADCPSTDRLDRADVVFDALFGTGLSRGLARHGQVWALIRKKFHEGIWSGGQVRRPYLVALDIPSGLCADSGRTIEAKGASGHERAADLTVTFHAEKLGHRLSDGGGACGALRVVDIGIRHHQPGDAVRLATSPDRWVRAALSKAAPGALHKYHHGHALVLSGGVGKGGAARLAARAALRVGAGLVTVGCPPAALIENACQLSAIMLRAVRGPDTLEQDLEDRRINAICLGPGMGVGERTRAMVATAGGHEHRGLVLDADALTSFEADPEALFRSLNDSCVLTPHEGEFGRLFPDILERLRAPATAGPAYSKVDATREAAARAGCVVLFKGADTVIADPEGRACLNSARYERSAPWLATAGSGDVLAGMITGLLARGFSPMAAAETAAWLHVECARSFGPGPIAEDLPEQLPTVFATLGL